MSIRKHYYKYLYLDGSPGVKSSNVDGSAVSQEFIFDATENTEVERMLIMIQDDAAISAEKYGGLAALTNGVIFELFRGGVLDLDFCDGVPVKSNAHWGALCYDVEPWDPPVGDKFVLVRWTFAKSGLPLYMYPTDRLRMTIRDDLTGLVDHRAMIQGVRVIQ